MLILYSATVFLSAFLIFLVQPMIGKMILPLVGGAPAAWNSCLFFFQTLMLAGYAYAHFSLRRLGLYRQALTHLLLMAAALILLPISFDRSAAVPEDPSLWLIVRLFKSAGLPFFVLAALSPLLQFWFSRTGHTRADNPYFLFAASNLGSFAALLLYPVIVEPSFDLATQAKIWAAGFALLITLLVACRLTVKSETTDTNNKESTDRQSDHGTMLKWLVAGLFPSALLLATTQFVTADISPVPLLWVIPLAIYLISYVMAFSTWNLSATTIESLFFLAVLLFPVAYFKLQTILWAAVPIHLFVLFAVSLYCHSYLAGTRPAASQLTGYYAIMSLGSVVGSVLVTFVAPLLFSSDAEYPLLIIFSCYLGRRFSLIPQKTEEPGHDESIILTVIMGIYAAAVLLAVDSTDFSRYLQQNAHAVGFDPGSAWLNEAILFLVRNQGATAAVFLLLAAILPIFILKKMPRINLALFSLISIGILAINYTGTMPFKLYSSRNFFGIKKVTVSSENNTIALVHGSTMHGLQSMLLDKMFEPLAYFHRSGPIGSIFDQEFTKQEDFRAGIIGLGIGSLLAYAKPGQEFTFYEIDPEVIKIAQNPDYFAYLTAGKDRCRVICGDGRRMLEKSPTGYYDSIIIDAFSSDSIPVHLLTSEALKIYSDRLTPMGAIIFHTTNRYIDLKPLLAALARQSDFQALHVLDYVFERNDPANFDRNVAEYVIFTRSASLVSALKESKKVAWQDLSDSSEAIGTKPENTQVWTDDSSSLFPLLRLFR